MIYHFREVFCYGLVYGTSSLECETKPYHCTVHGELQQAGQCFIAGSYAHPLGGLTPPVLYDTPKFWRAGGGLGGVSGVFFKLGGVLGVYQGVFSVVAHEAVLSQCCLSVVVYL